MSDREKWLDSIHDYPVKGCGRLDMSTSMPDDVTVGRVTSDRIRYVYFKDGGECVVLGQLCDHVAFRAAEHGALQEAARDLAFLAHVILRSDQLGAKNPLDGETSAGGGEIRPVRRVLEEMIDKVFERAGPEPFRCPKCSSREFHPIATCKGDR